MCKRLLVLLLLFATHAYGGEIEDARAAYQAKDFATALRILRPLADQGVPRAQWGIGLMMFNGEGVRRDLPESLRLIRAGAEGGIAEAQAALALMSYDSSIQPIDPTEAARWAQLAAAQGNSMGKVVLGLILLDGVALEKDEPRALLLIKEAADEKNPLGQYELGKIYLVGRGVAIDRRAGETLLLAAVAAHSELKGSVELLLSQKEELAAWRTGNTRLSCTGLACAVTLGSNRAQLKRDLSNMRWIEVAARALNVNVDSDLLYFYLGRASEGVGDLDAAAIYYSLASNQTRDRQRCNYFINNCDGVVLPRDADDRRYRVQSAKREIDLRETARMAKLAEERRIAEVAESARKARELEDLKIAAAAAAEREQAAAIANIRKASEEGSAEAQFQLARLLISGKGLPVDERAGIAWMDKAAQQGLAAAQFELGELYREGTLVPKDENKAELWLRRAAKQGNDEAAERLKVMIAARHERATAAATAAAAAAKRREAENQERAAASVAAAAAAARKQEAERQEVERKRKIENAAKLKSL